METNLSENVNSKLNSVLPETESVNETAHAAADSRTSVCKPDEWASSTFVCLLSRSTVEPKSLEPKEVSDKKSINDDDDDDDIMIVEETKSVKKRQTKSRKAKTEVKVKKTLKERRKSLHTMAHSAGRKRSVGKGKRTSPVAENDQYDIDNPDEVETDNSNIEELKTGHSDDSVAGTGKIKKARNSFKKTNNKITSKPEEANDAVEQGGNSDDLVKLSFRIKKRKLSFTTSKMEETLTDNATIREDMQGSVKSSKRKSVQKNNKENSVVTDDTKSKKRRGRPSKRFSENEYSNNEQSSVKSGKKNGKIALKSARTKHTKKESESLSVGRQNISSTSTEDDLDLQIDDLNMSDRLGTPGPESSIIGTELIGMTIFK